MTAVSIDGERAPLVRQVRSTMLLSSRAALTGAGLFSAYEENLSTEAKAILRELVAGSWLPIELAFEHYAACDALALSRSAQQALGRTNANGIRGTLMGTVTRLARTAGTTPVTMIEQMPRFWTRIFDGGSVTYELRGPKDADIRVSAAPLFRSEYFRHALLGFADMMLGLLTTRIHSRVQAFDRHGAWAIYRVQWV